MSKRTSRRQIHTMKNFIYRHLVGIGGICVGLLLVIEILFIGNIAYGIKWVQCGQRPVVEIISVPFVSFGSQPSRVSIIQSPDFFEEKFSPADNNRRLFCSLNSAESAAAKIAYPQNITIR